MDRLKRLQALQQNQEKPSSTRKRIVARVLHVNKPDDGGEEAAEAKMREEMKRMALKKQQEQEKARLELERKAAEQEALERSKQIQAKLQEELEGSSDESTDEEEHQAQPLLKPVFVPKGARQTVAQDEEDEEERERREQEERQREAHALLAEYVRMEQATSVKKAQEELEATSGVFDPASIDDTDGLDEEAELQAWRLRELRRVKREREEREAREREQIELERIRNMTESERQELDRQKQAAWEAKPKSDYRFLQKYYHKGAFFGDSEEAIVNRDFAQPTGEDRFRKDILPEAMQVKNFGKRGRTKWTHLTAEDTTEFTTGWGQRANTANYRSVGQMGGMRGDLSRPSKHQKR